MSITIREKLLKDGRQSLYLDVYGEEGRRKKFLKLYTFKRPKNADEKEHNKEAWKLAESIRNKRELEASASENGMDSPLKKKVNFVEYFEQYVAGYKKKNR